MADLVLLLLSSLPLVMSSQHWQEEPASVAVNPGQETVMACRVSNMAGDCRWEKRPNGGGPGVPVGIYIGKYEWAGRPSMGDCSLRILQADPDYDSGSWVCQVTASSFRATDTLISRMARLLVRGPPSSVSLSVDGAEGVNRLEGREGEEAVVVCTSVGGTPAPSLAWKLGDAWLETVQPTTEDQDRGTVTSTLRLPLGRVDQGKSLQCTVRHPALQEELTATAQLVVQFPPATSLSPAVPPSSLLEGSSHNFTCTVDANPPAQAVWVRTSTGERLGEGGVLQLREVTRQQAGEYSCTATNSLGTSQKTTLVVDVQFAAQVVSVRPGGSLTGQYGGDLTLHCEGAGSPAPSLTWQQTSSLGVTSRGSGPSLTLESLQYEDQGEYTCTASNKVGQERSPPVSLEVEGPPRVALTAQRGVQLLEGGDAVLEVQWCAAPFPKQVWLLATGQGEDVSLAAGLSHGKYRADKARPGAHPNCYISSLHILAADSLDSREYRLRLQNQHGTEEHRATLTVGTEWKRETVVGSVVGAASTLLVLLLLLICCCRSCCLNREKIKQDSERTV